MKILKIMLTAVAMAGSLFLVASPASASLAGRMTGYSSASTAGTSHSISAARYCPPSYKLHVRSRYCLPYCPPGYRLQSNGRYWYCIRWYPPPPPRCYPRPGYRCPLPEVTRH